MKFKNNKLGAMTLSEDLALFLSVILTFLIFGLAKSVTGTFVHEMEVLTPEINYQYPSIFVNTFLNLELDSETKKKFLFGAGDYYVKDLIWLGTDDAIKYVNDKYRTDYLENEEIINSVNYFNQFSKQSLDSKKLLLIKRESCISDSSSIENGNFAYYIRSKGNQNYYIFFDDIKDFCEA